MLRYILFVVLFYSYPSLSNAQTGNIQSFIPRGYSLLDSASGDLDKDALRDVVMVLKLNEESHPDSFDVPRPLLLLKGAGNDTYRLIARNDHVVLCFRCGGVFGDPFEGITIRNGFFSVEHYGGSNWRWTRIITFKYDKPSKTFVLHRDAGVSFHSSVPDKEETVLHKRSDFGKLKFGAYYNQTDLP